MIYMMRMIRRQNKRLAKVEVSDDKPCVLEFFAKKSNMTISLSYVVKNKYGVVCSH